MFNIGIILAVAAIVALSLWLVQAWRELKFCQAQLGEVWQQLRAELTARREMIPYLVTAAPAEAAALGSVIGNACDLAANVAGVQACSQAEGRLTAAIGRLFALLDSVPTAVVDENVSGLRAHLAEQEARIAMLVESYNRQAETFNTLLSRSPARLLARLALFQQAELFV